MNDNYTRLEESWIANFALKDQLELLKDKLFSYLT